ncbi:autotransporter domain-containing esterase [Pseudoxanthomonas broegbernensis]|uniref:Autotransporter domain-containing esterase n=1 Tax=Pseudoxanthomonas broegbernensis TaxID=83619 RepID=A0A7V8GNV7_9GAMM|nr:autotransporter domain-containing protein [Pseudoxanthomonas broegbernensis]KAF1687350.1 autotransporter domain-containing esterase [Pseudoxanthomonas broegbernensis]MBB6065648.1 outer membrane lipase/esterase [Pseudoxanthomonas broegbernensis]
MSFPRPIRSALAAALALACAPALAGEYAGTVFFGDSLTDAGHFKDQLPAPLQPIAGKFTTNPGLVWAEHVADYYGGDGRTDNQGGDNYAQGGSRVAVANGVAESTVSQAARYLAANGGKADPDVLYTVWTGANDIFAIAGAGAPVQETLATAVGGVVQIVGSLEAAGARYVLVPSMPDMGITPDAAAAGPLAQAALTQLASGYNDAMYGALAQAGHRVIPLDTFNMLREVLASPAAYGLRNVTETACLPPGGSSLACYPAAYVAPDAADTYLFADGAHPTGAVHAFLADYAVSVLEGPRLVSVVPHSATVIGRSRADQVAGHILARPEAEGLRWWGGLRADNQRYGHADLYDGVAPAGLFGIDWSDGRGLVAGTFVGHGRLDADFGLGRGDFTQTESTLGGFVGWYGERAWVNAQASYTRLDVEVNREVAMGPAVRRHAGDTDGRNTAFGVSGGYAFGEGAVRHGPVAALLWQQVELDGWRESNLSSSALAYPELSLDSLVGSLGWQASYDAGAFVPYARATWDHEFEDAPAQARARLQTLPDLEYAVPGLDIDGDYGTLVLGARFGLFGLAADLGARTTVGRKGGSDNGVFLSLSGGF